mmetsp:Transcript_11336/g.10848  ORF Transcript_11336/g.10848 Transcript_11336/m.10848 type:complete len:112 (-) Transcript_11336:374-709(-)|eukprot:CAMPEP_0197833260 /NCGR_PEP_ID=MMETSP1437-20131217/18396_1 /TAXON_ID=49252 ORGANISM="Eucampia antarctica, Strain CCMP1452" /NCGR_SAMPLE_ID=MMETSP1437 /ASSEMBLY_ACC=CAM_ASM_001096 /LENGTH=111 /DNA_ID=CAMNT_0043437223 /DNA_START=58 /DNA_END=393 /DNA_ORIENTATION=+
MVRFVSIAAIAFTVSTANAFTVSSNAIAKPAFAARPSAIFMSEDDEQIAERGVSMDQDGKSNVWAIEPKVEVETKSSEEKTTSTLIAGAGVVVLGGLAAFALANLPDPNQF